MCRSAHTRQSFEAAFENNFKCPECGDLMNQIDNSRTIEFLKKRLEDLEVLEEKSAKAKKKSAMAAKPTATKKATRKKAKA